MQPARVLRAGLVLSAVLGSLHAFSIFIAPLEQRFDAPRAEISFTYSLALLAVTLAMLAGDRVYRKVSAGRLAFAIGLLAAAGLVTSAFATAVWQLWLGYSLLFGLANGLGYGMALHAAGQSHPGREGWAMGLVTAAYAMGAAITPFALASWLTPAAVTNALLIPAGVMLVAGALAAAWLSRAGFAFRTRAAKDAPQRVSNWPSIALLWVGYGAATAAGLMAIGHASEIARSQGAGEGWALAAPTLLALANMAGSVGGGMAVDQRGVVPVLIGLPVLSAGSLLALALLAGTTAALACLTLTGFAYGATIAAYPAAVVRLFGSAAAVRVYGVVFTAWGAAGFLAPWCAGLLFDATGSYRAPLLAAAGLALASAACIGGGHRLLSTPQQVDPTG